MDFCIYEIINFFTFEMLIFLKKFSPTSTLMLRSNAPVITAKTGEHDFTGGEYRSSDHFRRWSPQKSGDVQNIPTYKRSISTS